MLRVLCVVWHAEPDRHTGGGIPGSDLLHMMGCRQKFRCQPQVPTPLRYLPPWVPHNPELQLLERGLELNLTQLRFAQTPSKHMSNMSYDAVCMHDLPQGRKPQSMASKVLADLPATSSVVSSVACMYPTGWCGMHAERPLGHAGGGGILSPHLCVGWGASRRSGTMLHNPRHLPRYAERTFDLDDADLCVESNPPA